MLIDGGQADPGVCYRREVDFSPASMYLTFPAARDRFPFQTAFLSRTIKMKDFINRLFSDPEMLRMGHAQRLEDHNLGLGWIYYALGRLFRSERAVVIGSYRGFVPAVFAKSLQDNNEEGEVIFIDPSYVDDFWEEPGKVQQYFSDLGLSNIRHYRYTTQDFVKTGVYEELSDIGIVMIDGYHSAEQARFDYLAFMEKMAEESVFLFHDSIQQRTSTMYGNDRSYEHTVCQLMDRMQETSGIETMTLPFGSGVTLVTGRPDTLEYINMPFENDEPEQVITTTA